MKQLISLKDCIACGDCCYYHSHYLHLSPILEKRMLGKKFIDENRQFLEDEGKYFRVRCPVKKSWNHYFCAFKQGNLCRLKDKRSFECKLYPFNIMKDREGRIVLGIDRDCRGLKNKTEKQIKEHAKYLKPALRRILKTKKFYIEEFQPELEIIESL